MNTTEQAEFVCVTKPDTLGVVDITDLLPSICLKCKHMELSVKAEKIYSDSTPVAIGIQVVCSNRHMCNYIMEMMKCDERTNTPT